MERPGILRCLILSCVLALSACGGGGDDDESSSAGSQPTQSGIGAAGGTVTGPNGSKGVGEPPCVATAGAIANAITGVIGSPVRQLPMTPQRVWATLSNGGA